MKILHVSTYDIYGGAARATYRLHNALLNSGIDSKILVRDKLSNDSRVLTKKNKLSKILNLFFPLIDRLPLLFYKYQSLDLFSTSWLPTNISKSIKKFNPDIIHIHWVNHGMLNLNELKYLNYPIIWTMHDDWVYTGGCHVKRNCNNYINKCGKCPILQSNHDLDLSRINWGKKYSIFKSIKNLSFVTVSNWLYDCSKSSSLLKNYEVNVISNTINTDIFKKCNKYFAKDLWNLDHKKKYIIYGGSLTDPNKSFNELLDNFNLIEYFDFDLIVFGSHKPPFMKVNLPKLNIIYTGLISDDTSLITLYSCADAVIVPSKQESFSQIACEAISCSIPVIAFNYSGVKDIIDHKINGYLAQPYNFNDFIFGINWVLHNINYEDLCIQSRIKAVENFDYKVIAEKYISLYNKNLKK